MSDTFPVLASGAADGWVLLAGNTDTAINEVA